MHPFKQEPNTSILDADDFEEPLYEVSTSKRMLHYIIDILGFYLFSGTVIYLSFQLGLNDKLKYIPEPVTGIVLMLLYYWSLETLFNQTVGKMITGLVVVTEDGHKPNGLQILIRTLCRFVPFEAFTFFSMKGGLHDRWSKTRVVKK